MHWVSFSKLTLMMTKMTTNMTTTIVVTLMFLLALCVQFVAKSYLSDNARWQHFNLEHISSHVFPSAQFLQVHTVITVQNTVSLTEITGNPVVDLRVLETLVVVASWWSKQFSFVVYNTGFCYTGY